MKTRYTGRKGLQYTAKAGTIVNPTTGRVVKAEGRVGAKLLKGEGLLPRGTKSTKAASVRTVGGVKTPTGALRRQEFALQRPAGTTREFALTIRRELDRHGADARGAKVRFVDGEGNAQYKTVKGSAKQIERRLTNFQLGITVGSEAWKEQQKDEEDAEEEDINDWVNTGPGGGGSDAASEESSLDAGGFAIDWVVSPSGGSGGSYKARETPFFKLQDYNCLEGDCLLAILRDISTSPPKGYNKPLRKRLGIAGGAIGVEYINALAKEFNTAIEVYTGELDIERTFDDTITNKCHTVVSFEMLARSEGAYPKTAQVLLEGADSDRPHYARIAAFKKVETCPVTGDIEMRSVSGQRARVLEQGRAWKPLASEKGKKAKTHYKTHILVYDFETTWSPEEYGRVQPYSLGWLSFPLNDPPKDFSIMGEKVHLSKRPSRAKCAQELLQYIEEAPGDVRYLLVSFNGSRFDHFLLAEAAQSRECLSSVFWGGGCLREISIWRHKTYDLAKLCPGTSLKDACKGFDTSPQKVEGFDHQLVQQARLEGRLEEWLKENRVQAELYLIGDVLCTAALAMKLSGAILDITSRNGLKGIEPLSMGIGTVGGVAWKAFAATVSIPKAAASEEVDAFIRQAITGGRVQNFKKSGYTARGKYRMVDVKSLYPTVMYAQNAHLFDERLHYGRFPTSEPVKTYSYVEGKLGVYNVTVKKQPTPRIVPRRERGAPLDWGYDYPFDCVLASCSIELIRLRGGEVETRDGYYFEHDTRDLFKSFLQPLFEEKDRQDTLKAAGSPDYNAALREVVKLLMNSCSGKTAQRNFDDVVVLAKGSAQQLAQEARMKGGVAEWYPLSGDACLLVGKKPEAYNAKTAKPSQLAVFIYEYSRTYLYEILLRNYDAHYCDTDSCLMTDADYERFRRDYPMLDGPAQGRAFALGDLEEEVGEQDFTDIVLIAPKCYLVAPQLNGKLKEGKQLKARAKGVCLPRDKLWIGKENPKGLTFAEKHELYTTVSENTLPLNKDPRPLFFALAEGEAKILCGQIGRSLCNGDTSFALSQKYLIKKLSPVKCIAASEASDDAWLDELLG